MALTPTHFVHCNDGGALFVKEADFFASREPHRAAALRVVSLVSAAFGPRITYKDLTA